MAPQPTLSFGIELEMLFAFHEDRLRRHLSTHLPGASIIKSPTREEAHSCSAAQYHGTVSYKSWCLVNAGEHDMTLKPSFPTPKGPARAYRDEPLLMMKEVLLENLPVALHNPAGHEKPTEFPSWIVTSDASLIALEPTALAAATNVEKEDTDSWDSYGVELVSPPYTSVEAAQKDLTTIFSALRPSGDMPSDFAVATNNTCGLHVHVGLPDGSRMPLKALQHLAFLTLVYEEEITRLHAFHRRHCGTEIVTNRERFLLEGCTEDAVVVRGGKKFEPLVESAASIRKQVFGTARHQELAELMGEGRYRIVNWQYVDGAIMNREGPKTIEFRQHAGCVEPGAIMRWVRFCVALVGLAFRYAEEGSGVKAECWDDKIEVEKLMVEMGLAEEDIVAWEKVVREYEEEDDCPLPYEYYVEWFDDDWPDEVQGGKEF
jgi:Putative amidoligase enzyme